MKGALKRVLAMLGIMLMALSVVTPIFALDPQGHGDGNYPFNDSMSNNWVIPPDVYVSITTYGIGGDNPITDAGNYEYRHSTYYVITPQFDIDCYAWVSWYRPAGGENGYTLIVGRMDASCYGLNLMRDMRVTFSIPDDYKSENTIRAWEIKYEDRAIPEGDYYYSISYGAFYWTYTYAVKRADYGVSKLEANDGWGCGYKTFAGIYHFVLYQEPTSASYYWAVLVETKTYKTLYLKVDFNPWVTLRPLGVIAEPTITFELTAKSPIVMVGGTSVPVNKFALLAPYFALVSAILVTAVTTAIYVKCGKHRKKQQTFSIFPLFLSVTSGNMRAHQ